jgi:FMN-dependent NADH-azoreductase
LTEEFVRLWKKEHPEGEVVERDLIEETFPEITDDWISAALASPSQWTDRQRTAMARSDIFISELMAADIILIGTPMHNFNVSWPLKAWIDQIVRIGKTVVYDQNGPRGMLEGKRVVVISSRGGGYRPGSARAQMDFLEPYVGAIFGFIGLTDIIFIRAENQYRPDQAPAGKAAALREVAQTVAEISVSTAQVTQ